VAKELINKKDYVQGYEKISLCGRYLQDRSVHNLLLCIMAEMCGTETRVLKQAVRRNIKCFEGEDFMFEVTREELSRSQFVTLNKGRGTNIKYLPFTFTELGVAMLSSVLNSDTAIEVNRGIMRAFVAVRQLLMSPPVNETNQLQSEVKELKKYIEEVFADYNDMHEDTRMQLDLINEALAELQTKHKHI
jgi:hypothetical protein